MSDTTTETAPAPPHLHVPPGTVPLITPALPATARRGWRRLVTGHNPQRTGAFALNGIPLDPGLACVLPLDALVVTADAYTSHWVITAYRVHHGLDQLHQWHRRSPLGPREVRYIAARLAPGAATHQVLDREILLNRPGRCELCGQNAPAGRLVLTGAPGRWHQTHHGPCPPRPAELPRTAYGGMCLHCSKWVEPGAGTAILIDDRPHDPATHGRHHARYRPAHYQPCPPDALPGPPTSRPHWCHLCGHRINPGAGYRDGTGPRHTDPCPPPRPGPYWTVRRRTHNTIEPGTVLRLRLTPRPGEPPIPPDAPGTRILDSSGHSDLIAVVLDCLTHPKYRTRIQVRPATWDEAADLLAADLDHALDARPAGQGFTARWIREQIAGDRPWLAEITGRHPHYGYHRRFLRPQYDADTDAPAGRGALFCWTLSPNRLYEASWPGDTMVPAWRELRRRGFSGRVTTEQRAFLRVTQDGDIDHITREEADAWLTNAPVWAAAAQQDDVPHH